jgi:hypothetical protein
MIRIGTILLILLTINGCSRLKKSIPVPTEDWSYIQIKDFNKTKEAAFCLLLSYDLKDVGDIGLQTIFFKRQSPPQKRLSSISNMSFSDGDGWSSGGSFKTTVSQTNIIIHKSQYYTSDDADYEFEENIEITYSRFGESSAGRLNCSWEWIELNSSKQWNKLSKETSVDWLEIFSQEAEAEVKQISPNQEH